MDAEVAMARTRRIGGCVLVCWLGLAGPPALAQTVGAIVDIGPFLERCPTQDVNYARIRSDFELRRNGVPVGTVACSEPVSSMPTSQYTDELIVLQGLRVVYYMDRGRSGHLPWTIGTLYDWMRSRIGGIDIRDGSGSFCCLMYDGVRHIAVGAQDDFNREFDKAWRGISGNIGLYAHESRHADGFGHTSCCGIASGCDDAYSEGASMPPYGIQWFLEREWLQGGLYVGLSCLPAAAAQESAAWHLASANSTFRTRFCTDVPPLLSMPAAPGGQCLNEVITAPTGFYTVPPCRLFDSRDTASGSLPLPSGVEQSIAVHGRCGVSTEAKAVSVNVTVTQAGGAGHLTLYPGHLAPPSTSSLNFAAGQTRANNAVVFLALDGTGTLGVAPYIAGGRAVHVIVDVTGYFQ